MANDTEDKRTYRVVINDEEQYSIVLAHRDNPAGWRDAGKAGPKADCLAYIETVWTDMRPKSLRAAMESQGPTPGGDVTTALAEPPQAGGVDGLVQRLADAQEVEATVVPRPDSKLLKEAIDRGFVFMTFLRTGTKVGVSLDRTACDVTSADFEAGTGVIRLQGDLTLNYNRVRYHGDVDLRSLRGTGRLAFVAAVKPGA